MNRNLTARLIHEIGVREYLRIHWNTEGQFEHGFHDAKTYLKDIIGTFEDDTICPDSKPEDYQDDMWSTQCDTCGMVAPEDAERQVFTRRLYDTASGFPEPGDLYYATWIPPEMWWDNQEEPALTAILPNGWVWVIDSRASNCTMKDDRLHRCWVKHGEPPNLTVNNDGFTCQVGAGSIIGGDWHGFLTNGEFIEC